VRQLSAAHNSFCVYHVWIYIYTTDSKWLWNVNYFCIFFVPHETMKSYSASDVKALLMKFASRRNCYCNCNYAGHLFIFEHIIIVSRILLDSSPTLRPGRMLDIFVSVSIGYPIDCSTCRFRRQLSANIYNTRRLSKWQVKLTFYSGHPSNYWPHSLLVNFGDRTRTGITTWHIRSYRNCY
jgi:hypothetical protein